MKQFFTILVLFLSLHSNAQTWTGASSNDWFTAGNWSPATVPTSSSSVTIPGSLATPYPTLTGPATVASFTMASGSVIHLGGNFLTDNGSISMTSATIDGAGTLNVVSPANVSITGSTLIATTTISNFTGSSSILNNSFTGSTTISDATAQNTGANYIDGNLFTGNLTVTHNSATDQMLEGYNGATNDHVTGNATFTINGAGTFYSSYSHSLVVDGNLSINRTISGQTFVYNTAGGSVGGNFTYASSGGNTTINPANSVNIPIGGTINVTATAAGQFIMYHLKNTAAGGTVSIDGSNHEDIINDTLKATLNLTNYTSYSNIINNSITGNTTISDVASQNTGSNYIDGNLFTGNLNITHASATDAMLEGYNGVTNNHVTGNFQVNLTGSGSFTSSYSHSLIVDGNFSVTRTVAGPTNLFNTAGGSVGGNMSYSSVGGDFVFNPSNSITIPITGTLNISQSAAANFHLYHIKNLVSGGTISVTGSSSQDLQFDTVKATVSLTNYSSVSNVINNSIQGNLSMSDIVAQNTGTNYLDGNLITGNLAITHNSATDQFYEGFNGLFGNHITGDMTVTITGAGGYVSGYSHGLQVDGNYNVTRSASGYTEFFRTVTSSAYSVGANFSFSSTGAGGDTYFNNSNVTGVVINGMLTISTSSNGLFKMIHLKNAVAGGSITVNNSSNQDIEKDTIKAGVSISRYTGPSNFFDNSILGNVSISDSSTQNTSTNNIDGNLITGDLNLTHASLTDYMYEGYGGNAIGDHITGNMLVLIKGAGGYSSSYSQPLRVDGNMTVNRTVGGTTELFRSATNSIGGDLSVTNSGTTGDLYINQSGSNQQNIAGMLNVSTAAVGIFRMTELKNGVSGGTVNVANATQVIINDDTIKSQLSLVNYTSTSQVYDNHISGNTLISDAVGLTTNSNYVDGNLFDNNFCLVHNSATDVMYEGFGSPTGHSNVVKGIDSIVNHSPNVLNMSYSHSHRADSTFILNALCTACINMSSLTIGGSTSGHLRQASVMPIVPATLNLQKTGGARLILDTNLYVSTTANFTSGYIQATDPHSLFFLSGATYTGAGNASHVIGTVHKVGNQAFTFPLGDGDHLSPAGISAPSSSLDTFYAQYVPVMPNFAGYDSSLHDVSIDHISRREYWLINRNTSSTSNVFVTLGFVRDNSGQVTNLADLRVAHWYGSPAKWHDEGNGSTTGTLNLGTVTSTSAVTSFSPFTLASSSSANPLPVKILSFDAQKLDQTALLNWIIAEENGLREYQIQRSTDGLNFEYIGTVAAGISQIQTQHSYQDMNPALGINYYRIVMISKDGVGYNSEVRNLEFQEAGNSKIKVYPNPVSANLFLTGLSSWKNARMVVRGMDMRVIYKQQSLSGDDFAIQTSSWPAGVYQVELSNTAQTTHFSIVKQ